MADSLKRRMTLEEVFKLPAFSKASITKAELKEAFDALAPHVDLESPAMVRLREQLRTKLEGPKLSREDILGSAPLEKNMTLEEVLKLPAFSKDFLSEAEVKEALRAIASHVGLKSPAMKYLQEGLEAKMEKTAAKVTRTLKSVLTGGAKGKSSKKKKD